MPIECVIDCEAGYHCTVIPCHCFSLLEITEFKESASCKNSCNNKGHHLHTFLHIRDNVSRSLDSVLKTSSMKLENLLLMTKTIRVLEDGEFFLFEILFHFSYLVHSMH